MTKSTKVKAGNPEANQLDSEVVQFRAKFEDSSPLDEIIQYGACKMLQAAIDASQEWVTGSIGAS